MSAEEDRAGRQQNRVDGLDEREIHHLIARYKGGDAAAFGILMRHYQKQVAALAYRISGDYDDAADITQAVFGKMATNLARFDDRRKFYTWLYRITVNCSIDHLRRVRRYRHESLDVHDDHLLSPEESPEAKRNRERLGAYIAEATRALNERQRSAFVLRDVEGCRVDDVAQLMDVPEATVRWYLYRARTRLRKDLLRRCPQLLMLFGVR